MGSAGRAPRFHEVQVMRMAWVWLLVAGTAALAWWGFTWQVVLDRPWGARPAPDLVLAIAFALAGVALPLLLVSSRLVVEVGEDALTLVYRPLARRRIPFTAIERAEAVTYRPIAEYGGWGLRWWPRGGWAWTVQGNRGVRLHLAGGRRLLVGSTRPEALVAALHAAGVPA